MSLRRLYLTMHAMTNWKERLADVNLSALSRKIGVNVRTLQRLRTGKTPEPLPVVAAALNKQLAKEKK